MSFPNGGKKNRLEVHSACGITACHRRPAARYRRANGCRVLRGKACRSSCRASGLLETWSDPLDNPKQAQIDRNAYAQRANRARDRQAGVSKGHCVGHGHRRAHSISSVLSWLGVRFNANMHGVARRNERDVCPGLPRQQRAFWSERTYPSPEWSERATPAPSAGFPASHDSAAPVDHRRG